MGERDRMRKLIQMLKRHEGTGPIKKDRFLPYKDSVGKLTIGWGRNLDDRGITEAEANYLLERDIHDAAEDLSSCCSWSENLNKVRQDVLIDMVFNLGIVRFLGFKKLRAAIEKKNWTEAAKEMLDSKWAKQVGQRATELADMMLTGEYKS